ncbi:MAG: hypothetical protein K2W95_03200 [Candidatus Obscuribacterales bacterium]|nr:hypothetical protein [Candidatus Obscuribacterales bacterium]
MHYQTQGSSAGDQPPKPSRPASGSSLSEIPVVLFVFLIGLLFPMIDLAVIAYRTSYLHSAAHNAAHSAARAQTFMANGSKGELSAINIAKRDALATKSNGAGGVNFTDQDVKVTIIGTPIKAGKPEIRSTAPLTDISTKDYMFQIEVTVDGRVEPLVVLSESFFGKVQGLTVPIQLQSTYKEFCEHPSGLSK